MTARKALMAALFATAALAGCKKTGDIVIEEGIGVTALRSVCPAVGVPEYLGDMTLFKSPTDRTQDALDVTATITNVRSQCTDVGDPVQANASFDVLAQRRDGRGARTVQLPYFSTVVRGGSTIVAKRLGTVALSFADGQTRAVGHGSAQAFVSRAAATLPEDVRQRITQRRRAGQEEAAIDPLSQPEIRAAVARASFELLIGFQLTDDQLAYNATR
jgi:hypothetical protein